VKEYSILLKQEILLFLGEGLSRSKFLLECAKLTNKPRYFAKQSEIEQTNFKFIKNNEKQQKLLQQKEHYLKHIH
jgi:hypothetical protein